MKINISTINPSIVTKILNVSIRIGITVVDRVWLLLDGIWNDSGKWDDVALWID